MDILLYQFSKGKTCNFSSLSQFVAGLADVKLDKTPAHLMVNCLAITLGLPSDSNHMYPRIFNPAALNGTKGPGSDYNRENWDCGYKMEFMVLTTQTQPPIMGNNTQYRLALNTLVWGALSWCTLVDPVNGLHACKTNNHFLNALADAARTGRDARRQRTELEQVRWDLFTRYQQFYSVLAHNEDWRNQHIDSCHFITESLFKLWELAWNKGNFAGRSPALKSIYRE